MIDIISYPFMQRALISGVFVALVCAVLGVFLVLRKSAFIGEGLAHISFSGIAIGLILGQDPILVALAVTLAAAIVISYVRQHAILHGDTALAIFSYAGFALGIFLISAYKGFSADLFSYLFGSILTISQADMLVCAGLSVLILAFVFLLYNELALLTFNEETAKVSGIRTDILEYIFSALVSAAIVISMRIVGIILVASFIIMPAASALLMRTSFRKTIILSAAVSVISLVAGLSLSFYFDFAAGATIVLCNFLIFASIFSLRRILVRT